MASRFRYHCSSYISADVGRGIIDIFLLVVTCLFFILPDGWASSHTNYSSSLQVTQSTAQPLSPDRPVSREIKREESHLFSVPLSTGQYARIVVERRGIDLTVSISSTENQATRYENPAGEQSPIFLSVIARTSGNYLIEVRTAEKWAAAGRYEIRLEEMRAATSGDERRLEAERKVAEGRRLQLMGTEVSRRESIAKYLEALAIWKQLSADFEEANTLHLIAQTHKEGGNFEKAFENYSLALARRSEGDRQAKAYTLLGLAAAYRDLSDSLKAIPIYQQAREIFEQENNRRGVATALYNTALIYARRHNSGEALKYCQSAIDIYRAEGDHYQETRALNLMGGIYEIMGQPVEAIKFFEQSLKGWQAIGDLGGEGNAYNNIGKNYDDLNEWQQALENYNKALALYEEGEKVATQSKTRLRSFKASTLYNMGAMYLSLGDWPKALENLEKSLKLREEPRGRGITLMHIGYAYAQGGDPQKALAYGQESLRLLSQVADPRKAQTLTVMGMAYDEMGAHEKAVERYQQALEIQQSDKSYDPQGLAITLGKLGVSYAALGKIELALATFNQGLSLQRRLNDKNGEALTLYQLARLERQRKNLPAALKLIEASLKMTEPLRTNLTSRQLRSSYFALKVNYYELFIDLQMQLRSEGNLEKATAAAFEASERARARSLLDMLSDANVEAGSDADPALAALVEKRRLLIREFRIKTLQQRALRENAGMEKGLRLNREGELDRELTTLGTKREKIEAQIKAQFQHYASLMYPQPLTVKEIQQLLDENTLILEFALGEDRSYLWALTSRELSGYQLPPRAEIESSARRLKELLRAGQPLANETAAQRLSRITKAEAEYWPQAAEFSRMLLGPAASQLKNRRLIVIADGELFYLPFGALPSPSSASVPAGREATIPSPLILDHEIISLPSASVLSALRQIAKRPAPAGSVAVFADPVFERDDPRIQLAGRTTIPVERRSTLQQTLRDMDEADEKKLPRLQSTAQEARDILSFAPVGSAIKAVGLKANRENATNARLAQYRIIHFATHGLLNEKNPELSGIVLSLYDEQGRFREEGFIRLGDIYNLNLPVELVVLSACRTGLGKEVRGEGLIGLTRGFMYAGAIRVVASLWKVDDAATAEMMKLFYQRMLKDKMPPAAALREAQLSMWKQKRWHSPYFWSAFILQGDWK